MHPEVSIPMHQWPLIPAMNVSQTLPGRYTSTIQNVSCALEFKLDPTGCLTGEFIAEGERLEIIGGVPNGYGEVFGLIREPGGDTLAVVRATPNAMGLDLEMDTPKENDLFHLGHAERVVFKRLEMRTQQGIGITRFAPRSAPTATMGGSR